MQSTQLEKVQKLLVQCVILDPWMGRREEVQGPIVISILEEPYEDWMAALTTRVTLNFQ